MHGHRAPGAGSERAGTRRNGDAVLPVGGPAQGLDLRHRRLNQLVAGQLQHARDAVRADPVGHGVDRRARPDHPAVQQAARRAARPLVVDHVRVHAVVQAQIDEARLAVVRVEAARRAVVGAGPVGVAGGADHQHRALAVRLAEGHQIGQLPVAPLRVVVLGDGAAVGPVLQVGRGPQVSGAALAGALPYRAADELLPQPVRLPHLRVPVHRRGGVGALFVGHHLVLVPGQPAVGAARQHAVGLGVAGDVAGVQGAGKAVVVDEGVAGVRPGHVVAAVGPHRHRPVFPLQQVGRAGVPPADRALAAVGVHRTVLVEQVVRALMVDGAVGIVHPSLRRREVVARAVRVVGHHPAAQLAGRAGEYGPLPAGHGHAKVAYLPGAPVSGHP